MLLFPNAKINIGLQITGKREDGYHNLETLLYPIHLMDALEIIPAEPDQDEDISFTLTGIQYNEITENNICFRAYQLLKRKYKQIPKIEMHLHKGIPLGAGLGGGSSDGVFTLTILNTVFSLGVSENEFLEMAAQLGSDCPFFVRNIPQFATGRGEILEPLTPNLSGYKIYVVCPHIEVSTANAFSKIEINTSQHIHLREAVLLPPEEWKDLIKNDFEPSVFSMYPQIASIKNSLYDAGAVYAAMSGSGSSVFGIFKEKIDFNVETDVNYFSYWV